MENLQITLNQTLVGNLTVGQLVLVVLLTFAAIGLLSVIGFVLRIPRMIFGPGCGCLLLVMGIGLAFLALSRP